MKKLTNTIFFIFALALNMGFNRCLAAENVTIKMGNDYIITTAKTIKANEVSNPSIITVSPFFTIFNEKNVLLLHPAKVGKTNLTFFLKDGSISFEIIVKPNSKEKTIESVKKGDFEFNLLDSPPKIEELEDDFELDAPPVKPEGK